MGGLFTVIEFTYNRSMHFVTEFYSFEVVYRFNQLTLEFDFCTLGEHVNCGKKKADFVKQIHE